MEYDDEFVRYFEGRLRQVFLYVTDRCGLRCEQCLYKTTLGHREMRHAAAMSFLADFRRMGAEKFTLIGGEPMLYGLREGSRPLVALINYARQLGYEYIRLDTNGQQGLKLVQSGALAGLSNLSVSIDGHTAEINDQVRGRGTLHKARCFVQTAVEAGHYTTITTCVHPGNVDYLDAMVEFAASHGVAELNLHPLFKMGIERDNFSGDTDISPQRWMAEYDRMRAAIEAGAYPIQVRIPRRFVPHEMYRASPAEYEYCPSLMGERILVHPNGEMRVCALCIGTPITVAHYCGDQVSFCGWESEISAERRRNRPCMSQVRDFGDLTPLCISYKPFQKEHVWLTQKVDERLFGRTLLIVSSV